MGTNSPIEWTETTWSPASGCTKVSDGCLHCYIERTPPFRMHHRRFDVAGIGGTTGVQLHPERLTQPLRWRRPRKVFVCSTADLFHPEIPDSFIAQVWAVMALSTTSTFQVLTKRHARLRSLLTSPRFAQDVDAAIDRIDLAAFPKARDAVQHRSAKWLPLVPSWPLPNVWVGTTIENQQWADRRICDLLSIPAAVHWVSAEPLLSPITLCTCTPTDPVRCKPHQECSLHGLRRLDWVVAGGETGPGARPMHASWARSLRDQCTSSGIPFFFKQWGDWSPTAPLDAHGQFDYRGQHLIAPDGTVYSSADLAYPDGSRRDDAIRAGHTADLHTTFRVGKKRAGRRLDDRQWNQYPLVATS